jgi:hypothetical protein
LRLKRLLLRGSAVGVVVATFIAAGVVGATAIRAKVDDGAANRAAKQTDSANPAQQSVAPPTASVPTTASVGKQAAGSVVRSANAAPIARNAAASRGTAPIGPVLPMGSSELPDGVTAMRGDSDVVVSFDLTMVRTRRPDKFEQFVRTTLPVIYGRGVRDLLARIPYGGLASQGDLVNELPRRGMRIPVTGEWTIRVLPETRPGQDGPLVVRYRVAVVPSGD